MSSIHDADHGRVAKLETGMANDSLQPLKPQHFHILLALAGGECHGSGIMREVLELTSGHLRLWPAMLYSTLEQMLEQGWIEELTGAARPPGEKGHRRFYRITSAGRGVLASEAERLSRLVEVARVRNRLREGRAV